MISLLTQCLLFFIIGVGLSHQGWGKESMAFCDVYSGNLASDTFCRDIACKNYCESTTLPHYCMSSNYVKNNYCTYKGEAPPKYCTTVAGKEEKHDHWCQTVACSYASYKCLITSRNGCYSNVAYWVNLHFGSYCRSKDDNTSDSDDSSCDNGGKNSSCGDGSDSNDDTTRPSTTTTTRPPTTTSTPPTTTSTPPTTTRPPTTTTTRRVTTTKPPTTTTTSAPGHGGCYAPKGWSGQPCAECPSSRSSDAQCPGFTWTDCYPTMQECKKRAGGGDKCSKKCPQNTLSMKRPAFKGPHCYNSEYGSHFGPNWTPSKKTAFEDIITSPSQLYRLIQVSQEDVPMMTAQWGLQGCDAATAMYENIVCALELLEERGVIFDAPKNGGEPASIKEFANNGDDQINRLEVASFFSHKFKETGRFVAWEERATGYAEAHPTYPPVSGASYHGRGPIQLSWNYNYGAFSEWFFKDKNILLRNPEKVDPEGPMGFIAAFWFWFSPRDFYSGAPVSGSLRTRDAIIHWTDNKLDDIYHSQYDAVAGLGLSTNVINGGIECTTNGESGLWRVTYFLSVASRLKVIIPDMNNHNECQKDKYCSGLTSGCTAISRPIMCTHESVDCDAEPDVDWATYTCKFA